MVRLKVSRRPDGRYSATLPARYAANGKPKTIYGHDAEAVRIKVARLIADASKGARAVSPGQATVAGLCADWLASRTSIRPTTANSYRVTIKLHITPVIGPVAISKLTAAHVSLCLSTASRKGRAPATVRHIRIVLASAIAYAVKHDLLSVNVADRIEAPAKSRPKVDSLTIEELRLVIAKGREDGSLSMWVLATLGLRRGEIAGLRWSDFNWKDSELTISRTLQRVNQKGGKLVAMNPKTQAGRRAVHVPPWIVTILKAHRDAGGAAKMTGYVYTWKNGGPLEPSEIYRAFRACSLSALGRSVRLHALRHTAATLMIAAGHDARTVADVLGHSSPAFTLSTYVHPVKAQHRAAVESIAAEE